MASELRPTSAGPAHGDSGEVDRLIFGTVGVGLYQATTAGRFLRANPKLAEILGWPSTETLIDEVVDIGAQLYVEPDFRAAKLAALGCSGHTQFVTEVRRRDGRRILISESACAVPGPQGGASFYIGSMTEVTELMAAQDALQTIERSYRDLFENATEGIFRSDPDGRILSANPAFVRLLGYDNERQMMLSINERGFVHYVDPRRSLEFRRRIMESGRLTNFESELVRRSGERIWVSENARVVRDRSGKVRWYEGTVQDISDRKRVEATLRHAQEAAERANDAKTRFLAAASHDLRQPYQAMRLLLHAVASRQIDAQSKALARRLDEAIEPLDCRVVFVGPERHRKLAVRELARHKQRAGVEPLAVIGACGAGLASAAEHLHAAALEVFT